LWVILMTVAGVNRLVWRVLLRSHRICEGCETNGSLVLGEV
jgi:hypothetical protein